MTAKTPKAAAATPAAPKSAAKPAKKVEAEAKPKQTPAKPSAQKKPKEEEPDSDSDADDIEEKKALTQTKKPAPSAKKAEAKEEPKEEEEEEDDEEDEDFDGEGLEYDLTYGLRFGFQQGLVVPAGEALLIHGAMFGDRTYPFHITNACLGPAAEDNDRACLILQQQSVFLDDQEDEEEHDHEHDHDHDHEHDDEEADDLMEIVCGVLVKDKCENLNLDLMLTGDFLLINTSQNTDIHITGRILPGDDDDEDDEYDMEDEDMVEEDEDMVEEDEEDEDTKAAVQERSMAMRKRLLEETGDSKKSKVEPKAQAKPEAKTEAKTETKAKPAEKKPQQEKKAAPTGDAPKPEAVRDFILGELKVKKSIKNTELGTAISNKFGMSFKKMGFPEGNISKFLETHAKGKVEISAEAIKLL